MAKRTLALLLATIMLLGNFVPALAAPNTGVQNLDKVTSMLKDEAVNKDGKIKFNLGQSKEKTTNPFKLFGGLEMGPDLFGPKVGASPTGEGFGYAPLTVNINKHGIDGKPFNDYKIFGQKTLKLVLEYYGNEDPIVIESKTFDTDTKQVTFDSKINMDELFDFDIYLEVGSAEDGTILGQIMLEESSGVEEEGTEDLAIAYLDLYQFRNTHVEVKTVDQDGIVVDNNPTTSNLNSSIEMTAGNLGPIAKDIPEKDVLVEMIKVNMANIDMINSGLNFSFTNTTDGNLIDANNNLVYFPEIDVDEEGIKPTIITLQAKPLVTTEGKYEYDDNYVKVDFSSGKYGEITGTATDNPSVYYVFRNTTLAKPLTPPKVEANEGFTFTGWEPELQTEYDQSLTHLAQYTYNKGDVVPEKPGEGKPSVPENYVKVSFVADENGSLKDLDKTIYWVNPDADVSFTVDQVPEVTPENGYHFDNWYVGESIQDPATAQKYSEATVYVAKFESDISDQAKDGFVEVKFLPGTNGKFDPEASEVSFYIKSGKDVDISAKEPTVLANAGYIHTGWKDEADAIVDLQAVNISQDAEFTAQYKFDEDISTTEKPGYVKVSFVAGEHGVLHGQSEFWVNPAKEVELSAPYIQANTNYEHSGWNMEPSVDGAIISDNFKLVKTQFTEETTITATYENLISDEQQDGFVAVSFNTGINGTIKGSSETTKTVYVKANVQVDLTGKAPEVTAKEGKKFVTWDKGLVAAFTGPTRINAVYSDIVSDTEIDGYTEIKFNAGANGKFKDGDIEKSIWVDPEIAIDLNAKANELKDLLVEDANYSFTQWENPVGSEADFSARKYAETTTFTAAYESDISDEAKEGFVEVKFLPGTNGKFNPDVQSKSIWVKPNVEVDLTDKAPMVEANENYDFTAWSQDLKASFAVDTDITAQYAYTGEDTIPVDPSKPIDKPEGFVTVKFEAGDHGQITEGTSEYYVKKSALVSLIAPRVEAEDDYKHTGWDSALTRSFSDDVTIITAQYKAKVVTEDPGDGDYVKVSFTTSKGSLKGTSNYWVLRNEKVSITAPEVEDLTDYSFRAWDPEVKESYGTDTEHKAIFDYTGQDIVPQKPGENKPELPDGFVKVEFKAGDHGSIANTETTIYWVNPEVNMKLEAIAKPTVKAADGWTHTGWDKEDTTEITENLEVIATYKANVVTTDPSDPDYVKVDFSAEEKGSFESDQVTEYWVLKGEKVSLKAPTVTPKESYAFTGWDPKLATSYNEATTHKAQYHYNGENVIPVPDPTNPPEKPEGFVTVEFKAGDHGKITEGTTEYYVKKSALVSLTAPTVEADEAYEHTGWDSALTRSFSDDITIITAQYEEITVPEPEQFTIKYLSMDTDMGTVTTTTETVTSADQIQGSKATPTDADKYEFVRWMNVENPTDASLTAETIKPTEAKNATYIAIFKAKTPEPSKEFTIWYVPADSTMASVSLEKETITEENPIQGSTALSKDEAKYKFVKWIDEEGNKVSEEANLIPSVTESTVFVAVFEEIPTEPVKHTVSFDANGGEGSMADVEVLEGDYTLPLSNFKKDGYNFTGWKVDGEGETLKAGDTIRLTKDIKLEAQWEEIPVTPEPVTYTVSYESGAGDAIGSMGQDTVGENEKYTVLKNAFQYKDHEFTGWLIKGTKTYLQPGDRIDVKGDITLVAQWKETSVSPEPEPSEKVTIDYRFEAEDASKLPDRVNKLLPKKDFVEEGSTVKAPAEFENVRVYDKGGYWTFVQWSPEKFANVKLDGTYTFVGTWKWNKEEPAPGPGTEPGENPEPEPEPKPEPGPSPEKPNNDRISGEDRVDTSIEVSKEYFEKAEYVIIVDSGNFPDAMTASVLAKQLNAPILLTSTEKLGPRVAAEIERLGANEIIIVGGPNSVSENVRLELAGYDRNDVERIFGEDRFETSAEVARRVVGITGELGKAVIASGEVFADALTVGPFASREGYPILLVRAGEIPKKIEEAIDELAIKEVYIAGGYTTVNKKLENDLPHLVERMAGDTRYETAIAIAQSKFAGTNDIFLANGDYWMDALVIGPVGGKLDMPILLTGAKKAPKSLKDYVRKMQIDNIVVIGGPNMVSDMVVEELCE